jgi:predicted Zn-dependent peptidase
VLAALIALLALDPGAAHRHVTLPNGAQAVVERMAGARTASVQLFLGARNAPETPATHGWRHLLEHLLVQGPARDIDARLERQGMFLTAETTREAIRVAIDAPPERVEAAIAALGELLRPFSTTAEEIAGEIRVIEQELALLDPEQRMSARAWEAAFEGTRLDPFGALEAMRQATPKDLYDLHWLLTQPANLAISVAGPVDVEAALRTARQVLEPLPAGPLGLRPPPDRPGQAAEASGEGPGALRSALVPGLPARETVAAYAIALALRARHAGLRALYSPTTREGLVSVWHPDGRVLDAAVTGLDEAQIAELSESARALAEAWARAVVASPAQVAEWRGLEAVMGDRRLLDRMRREAANLDDGVLREALERFADGRAVVVRGGR